MAERVKPKRRYNSPRRQEQAAATRALDPRRGAAAVRAPGLRGDDDGGDRGRGRRRAQDRLRRVRRPRAGCCGRSGTCCLKATRTTRRSPSGRGTARSSRSPTPSASSGSTRATPRVVKLRIGALLRGDPRRRARRARHRRALGPDPVRLLRQPARDRRDPPREARRCSPVSTSTAPPTSSGRSTIPTSGCCSSASAAGRPSSSSDGSPTPRVAQLARCRQRAHADAKPPASRSTSARPDRSDHWRSGAISRTSAAVAPRRRRSTPSIPTNASTVPRTSRVSGNAAAAAGERLRAASAVVARGPARTGAKSRRGAASFARSRASSSCSRGSTADVVDRGPHSPMKSRSRSRARCRHRWNQHVVVPEVAVHQLGAAAGPGAGASATTGRPRVVARSAARRSSADGSSARNPRRPPRGPRRAGAIRLDVVRERRHLRRALGTSMPASTSCDPAEDPHPGQEAVADGHALPAT